MWLYQRSSVCKEIQVGLRKDFWTSRTILMISFIQSNWTVVLFSLLLFCPIQGTFEGPSFFLCTRGDRWAEQQTRADHRAGPWVSSGPGRQPVAGAEERGDGYRFGYPCRLIQCVAEGGPLSWWHILTVFACVCLRSVRTSCCCASGSCLSSGTCRLTPTGPTSFTIPKRTGWVCLVRGANAAVAMATAAAIYNADIVYRISSV